MYLTTTSLSVCQHLCVFLFLLTLCLDTDCLFHFISTCIIMNITSDGYDMLPSIAEHVMPSTDTIPHASLRVNGCKASAMPEDTHDSAALLRTLNSGQWEVVWCSWWAVHPDSGNKELTLVSVAVHVVGSDTAFLHSAAQELFVEQRGVWHFSPECTAVLLYCWQLTTIMYHINRGIKIFLLCDEVIDLLTVTLQDNGVWLRIWTISERSCTKVQCITF